MRGFKPPLTPPGTLPELTVTKLGGDRSRKKLCLKRGGSGTAVAVCDSTGTGTGTGTSTSSAGSSYWDRRKNYWTIDHTIWMRYLATPSGPPS